MLNFKAQPEGYDSDDSDWEADVTIAPYLDPDEKKDYNPKVDVVYSVNAYMQRQHCQYAVKRILEIIGDKNNLLQCDGYESVLNALQTERTEKQIAELVSPGK